MRLTRTHRELAFAGWAMIACPLITLKVMLEVDPQSDNAVWTLLLGLPALLALAGAALLPRPLIAVICICAAPPLSVFALLVWAGSHGYFT